MSIPSRIWHAFLRILSILIDTAVVKLEIAMSNHKPMLSSRLDLSDMNRPEFFEQPELFFDRGMKKMPEVEVTPRRTRGGIKESRFSFRSETESAYPENNIVRGSIFEARTEHGAAAAPCVIIMHGWREPGVYTPYHWLLGFFLARLGINCVLTTQPYHGTRKPAGTYDGDLMLCGDMEQSVEAFRQSVGDIRSLVTWTRSRFTGPLGVGGFSLGGFVTGLVACVENRIDFALPIIASGNLIKGMWDKPLISQLKHDLDTAGVTEAKLSENWRIIMPVNFKPKLPPERIQVIAGLYDILIPPPNVEELHEKWNRPRLKWLPCGHVSIALCPRALVRTIVDFIKSVRP